MLAETSNLLVKFLMRQLFYPMQKNDSLPFQDSYSIQCRVFNIEL